ncbi:sugar transferase [Cryobacterium sp. TMT2-17-1]|uniref:sugar transferase n=1 Tax=Cryobacterium sp. TMT2-17-1 TaxID=1259248 RepID=UPI0010691C3E|nr:sugar transferase [Cryobacterium sp. TMT2-17-1]TFC47458.1 sugar transferase [Cryobacterium sp. TMT2-17-1]
MSSSERTSYDVVKRGLDGLVAVVGLVVCSPVLATIALLVAAKLGRPVLFVQDRPGLHGRVFKLYKFRTMKNVDVESGLVSDGQRLTPFGKALRTTSLDELPTLVNVLKGDMSMVGPRPLLVRYLSRYSPEQARRHEVRPGITGLAQANGRNALTWDEKFILDVQYVDSRGFSVDASILRDTASALVRRDGINADGQATMNEFLGRASTPPEDRSAE